jgi:hypothetical protein
MEKIQEISVPKIQEISVEHTCKAPFAVKLEVWISILAPSKATIAPPY